MSGAPWEQDSERRRAFMESGFSGSPGCRSADCSPVGRPVLPSLRKGPVFTDARTEGRTDESTEELPVLLDCGCVCGALLLSMIQRMLAS